MSLPDEFQKDAKGASTRLIARKHSDSQMPAAWKRPRSKVPLQEERYSRKLTQKALATAINTPELPITAETIRRLEVGAEVEQRDEILRRIATHFGLPEAHANGVLTSHVHGRHYPKQRVGSLRAEIQAQVASMTPEEIEAQLARLQAARAVRRRKKAGRKS